MGRKQGTSVMLLCLYALLICALLVLVLAGAKLYSSASEARSHRSEQRRALSYIQSQTAAAADAAVKPGPEGDMLVLTDPASGYETRIFLEGGMLRSQFSRPDAPVDSGSSETICALESFALTMADGMVSVTADGLLAVAACTGGGANG